MTTTRHATGTPADIDAVLAVFERLMHRLMATHAPELSTIELTMAQTKALYLVLAAGQLRMSELAARLGVTSSTATGQVDRLVETGLLERREDPADRRQVVVTATPAAEATLEHLRELNSHRMRELLSRIEPGDLSVVRRAIVVLDDAVAAEAAETTTTAIDTTATVKGVRS
jgi:MarR family transcriptional regulator, organic hydroperoxide resistance regulator